MEGITHILTGMIVQILCFIYLAFPFNIIFTIIFGFFSHFVIDTLAKITYHTPEAHKDDKFWVAWHIITPVLCLVLIIWVAIVNLFWFFLLGAISANLVDVWDWVILRPKQNKLKEKDPKAKFWGENLFIHPAIDWIREKPFSWLPNWNHEKKGVIVELITIVLLWVLNILLIPSL